MRAGRVSYVVLAQPRATCDIHTKHESHGYYLGDLKEDGDGPRALAFWDAVLRRSFHLIPKACGEL